MKRQELVERLLRHAVPFHIWGTSADTKTIENLLFEIKRGETQLAERPHPSREDELVLVRILHTALVRVYIDRPRDHGLERYTLEELKSQRGSQWHRRGSGGEGSRHATLASISEKMRPGESVFDAILRGFVEELGLSQIQFTDLESLHFHALPEAKQFRQSSAYPGLYTENTLEFATWLMPDKFYRPQYCEHEGHRLIGIFRWEGVASDSKVRIPVLYG